MQKVDNRLVVVARSEGSIRQVTATNADVAAPAQQASAEQPSGQPTQMSANQEKAMQVGHALQEAGLNGYDIEIMFQNGRCVLQGVVGTMEQRNGAAQVAGFVPGVQAVSNQLRVQGQAGPMVLNRVLMGPRVVPTVVSHSLRTKWLRTRLLQVGLRLDLRRGRRGNAGTRSSDGCPDSGDGSGSAVEWSGL